MPFFNRRGVPAGFTNTWRTNKEYKFWISPRFSTICAIEAINNSGCQI
jgi:hypothetical protein